jgi:hypothetical protein
VRAFIAAYVAQGNKHQAPASQDGSPVKQRNPPAAREPQRVEPLSDVAAAGRKPDYLGLSFDGGYDAVGRLPAGNAHAVWGEPGPEPDYCGFGGDGEYGGERRPQPHRGGKRTQRAKAAAARRGAI